ncbi:MAG: hypothetical protein HY075_00245 [Deltaproteobacteria bacterium]|nr:hypothetical protein [Deltaproteobacteria bacterium]
MIFLVPHHHRAALGVLALAFLAGCNAEQMLGKTPAQPASSGAHALVSSPAAASAALPAPLALLANGSLSVGEARSCAIGGDGRVACWGMIPSDALPRPTSLSSVSVVASGMWHDCALYGKPARLSCWGLDDEGQVSGAPAGIKDVKAVAAGYTHGCALTEDSEVLCWGAADKPWSKNGPDGTGDGPYRAKAIAAGRWHTCAINLSGRVDCWGDDRFGQRSGAAGIIEAKALAAGEILSCVIAGADNHVKCWGATSFGADAIPQPPGLRAKAIAVGAWQACAINEADDVLCWGSREFGAIDMPAGLKARQIAVGALQACATTFDDKVRCWPEKIDSFELGARSDEVKAP